MRKFLAAFLIFCFLVNARSAQAAFPTVGAASVTSFATSVTSMAVNLPASISSGDLLIAVAETRNVVTWSTIPTGFAQIFSPVAAGGVGTLTAFYKIATGSEGATVTWIANTGTTASWQTRKITTWHGTTPPEATTANSGGAVSTNNPPSLTPSWGSADTAWLAIMGNTAQSVTITVAPTNYTDLTSNAVSSGGAAANSGTAYRQLTATSEDPGAFTTGSDRWWMAATIGIRPAVAGGSSIKTVNGLAKASTKTVNGLAIASVKSYNGLQ